MSGITTSTTSGGRFAAKASAALDELDQRYHPAAGLRKQFNKVFPTHWSFMLGEVALYSFIVLLLTGTYLGLFFDPSMTEVTYDGVFTNLRGVDMSSAYASALHISFDVRGGLFVRQVHHWAALLFVAAMVAHMFRTFFTGAFRKPREANWIIGLVLMLIGSFEGFTGYSLPDDLLSGTGLRIMSGIILSIPVIGTWSHWAVFGGEFPGTEIIPRLYIIHVLLLPGVLLALIGVHVGLVWYQKHTQFPGPGRTEGNVVGVRILPAFAAKGGAFFAVTVGVIGMLGGLFQINPIWNFGPYNPAHVSAGSQPDFYMGWLDGMARLFPAWEIVVGNYRIPAVFWATVGVPPADLRRRGHLPEPSSASSPKDNALHNLLQRPRDVPVRTSLGVMAIAFYVVLLVSARRTTGSRSSSTSRSTRRPGWAASGCWCCRRWPTGCPTGSASACSAPTGRCWSTASRPASSSGCRTASSSRCTSRWPASTTTATPSRWTYQGASVPRKMNQLGMGGAPVPGSLLTPDPAEETAALANARHELAGAEIADHEGHPSEASEFPPTARREVR